MKIHIHKWIHTCSLVIFIRDLGRWGWWGSDMGEQARFTHPLAKWLQIGLGRHNNNIKIRTTNMNDWHARVSHKEAVDQMDVGESLPTTWHRLLTADYCLTAAALCLLLLHPYLFVAVHRIEFGSVQMRQNASRGAGGRDGGWCENVCLMITGPLKYIHLPLLLPLPKPRAPKGAGAPMRGAPMRRYNNHGNNDIDTINKTTIYHRGGLPGQRRRQGRAWYEPPSGMIWTSSGMIWPFIWYDMPLHVHGLSPK